MSAAFHGSSTVMKCNLMLVTEHKVLCFKTGKKILIKVRHKKTSYNISTSMVSLELTSAVNKHAELPPVSFSWRDFEFSIIQELQLKKSSLDFTVHSPQRGCIVQEFY